MGKPRHPFSIRLRRSRLLIRKMLLQSVQYMVHSEVLLHTVLHRFPPELGMLLPWLYHRDLLKRVFRDDLTVFSERCICYILDFHDVLLNFLLFPVSFISMVILPTQKGIIDQIISQIIPISYLFFLKVKCTLI